LSLNRLGKQAEREDLNQTTFHWLLDMAPKIRAKSAEIPAVPAAQDGYFLIILIRAVAQLAHS